uniref:FAR1 domain-containing protein n=1 Tax=Sipha flava TaxID=143950 RepID=A0A2S2QSB7_9HEMI
MDDIKNDIKVGQIFNSYEQFFETFKTFCDENYQPLIVTNNNKRQVTILCRHGYKIPSNSTGKRTKLHYNYVGCKAKITCFKLVNSTQVKITSVSLEHNHEISRTAFGMTRIKLTSEQKDVLIDLHDASCKSIRSAVYFKVNLTRNFHLKKFEICFKS